MLLTCWLTPLMMTKTCIPNALPAKCAVPSSTKYCTSYKKMNYIIFTQKEHYVFIWKKYSHWVDFQNQLFCPLSSVIIEPTCEPILSGGTEKNTFGLPVSSGRPEFARASQSSSGDPGFIRAACQQAPVAVCTWYKSHLTHNTNTSDIMTD